MDQQQKRPREDAAPASPKRLKHSVPVHIFYLGLYWYLDNTRCARDRIVDWLRNHTNYDDVTVDLLVPAKGEGQPKGTAWFHGYGDAPFAAARRAVGAGPATDPHAARAKNNLMFQEVKEHNGFAASEERRQIEICEEAEAEAAAAAPPPPAPVPAAAPPVPPPAAAPPPPAAAPPTPAAPVASAWRPGPEALWKRALPSVVVAYGGPVIHNKIEAAQAQLKGDKEGRRIWALDLPPPDSGGAPKRWFVATPAEVDEGYARLPPQDRHVYEVIDARRPCWAYFDLEFTRKDGLNAAVDGDALTTRVVSAACDRLVAAAGDRPLEIEVIVLASARPTKFSRHVVLRPHWTDGARRRPAPLAGSPHAGHLADVVIEALGDALTVQSGDARTTTSFVDTGVYTRDRCFRVWGSTKHGDKAEAAFDVTEQRVFPGSRPVAFTRSTLRETLVVPELQPGEIDCLEIDAPVEPPPPPPSPGAAEEAAAPAAPAPAGSWEDSWDGATATPLLDATALPHKFIIARAGDRGQPPALFAAAATAALAALRRDHRDNGDPTLMSWRYVAAEFPSERYLHLTVKGQGVFCRSRGRPHQNQNLVVTVDPVNGRCWQRCYDGADCARNVPTTSGGVCRIANRHELAAPADDLKVDRRALLAFEKNH